MSQEFYYEPPSRLQLVDKMAHLLRYSDFLLVVTGASGSGKTRLAHQLMHVTSDSSTQQAIVSLSADTGTKPLLISLKKALQLEANTQAEALAAIHEQCKALDEVGQHLMIVIDNAEWLNDEAIELLAGLLMSGTGGPRLVLAGEESLVKRLVSLGIPELLEGRVHVETLSAFTEEEGHEFLRLLDPLRPELTPKAYKKVYQLSDGYPGGLVESVDLLQGPETSSPASRLPLPVPHIAAIAVVILVLVGISLWQLFPSDVSSEPEIVDGRVSMPVTLPLDSVDQSEGLPAPIEMADERSELSKRLAAQEAELRANQRVIEAPPSVVEAPAKSDIVEESTLSSVPEVVTSPVVKDNEQVSQSVPAEASVDQQVVDNARILDEALASQEPVPAPAPAPEVVQKNDVEPAKVAASGPATKWLKEDQLLAWPAKGYTLQLLGARSEQSVAQFMAGLNNRDKLYYFRTVYKGAPWHVVVYGQYSDRTAANRAVSTLPEELKRLKPWARSIRGVQLDIKKK